MKIVQIQFAPWDKVYDFLPNGFNLKEGARVIVKTEMGTEIGTVVSFKEVEGEDKIIPQNESDNQSVDMEENDDSFEDTNTKDDTEVDTSESNNPYKPVVRLANQSDFDNMPSEDEKEKAIEFCKQVKNKLDLPMKIFDVHYAYDGSRITFAFIADGRVDFREMAKELTRHFGKTIRLQQIGIRDEAKIMGDVGHCGRQLCCKKFLPELASITSEMADLQQCAHRGSERISGCCGRLMCCLAYEQDSYEDLRKKMPEIGQKVNVDGQRGEIVGHHVLKQCVDVKFPAENGDGDTIVEVDLNRNKK